MFSSFVSVLGVWAPTLRFLPPREFIGTIGLIMLWFTLARKDPRTLQMTQIPCAVGFGTHFEHSTVLPSKGGYGSSSFFGQFGKRGGGGK